MGGNYSGVHLQGLEINTDKGIYNPGSIISNLPDKNGVRAGIFENASVFANNASPAPSYSPGGFLGNTLDTYNVYHGNGAASILTIILNNPAKIKSLKYNDYFSVTSQGTRLEISTIDYTVSLFDCGGKLIKSKYLATHHSNSNSDYQTLHFDD